LQFGWIDTCCINNSNKKETEINQAIKKEHDEAIKSMYEWFKRAEVCYAYLADVNIDLDLDLDLWRSAMQRALLSSHWFTSGWTVIELIAPPHVEFYQANWKKFGTKKGMRGILSKVTGIPQEILTGSKNRSDYTIFESMAWARHRMTSGLERSGLLHDGLVRGQDGY
jgi:hypothetical protein